jgi:hypothetical protein
VENHLKKLRNHRLITRIPTGRKNKHLRYVYVPVLPPPAAPNSTTDVLSIAQNNSTSGNAEDAESQQVNTPTIHKEEKGKKEASKSDPNGSFFDTLVEEQRRRDRNEKTETTIAAKSNNAA